MPDYNYDEFSTDGYEFDKVAGPDVGEKASDFLLSTTDGEPRNLLDFDGDFLVLEMGSITCPLFQSRRTIMEPLDRQFPNASFAVLYVREAHPGTDIPAHVDMAAKTGCATRLKEQDDETRTVFVDDFDGAAHQAFGSMPNAVFIINKNGCVVFRSDWNNPSATGKALKALTEGRDARIKSYFRPATPRALLRTLRNAGKGSAADFFRGLPFLFWTNVIKRNLRLLLNRQPVGSHDTTC